jgi:hypothetical protein
MHHTERNWRTLGPAPLSSLGLLILLFSLSACNGKPEPLGEAFDPVLQQALNVIGVDEERLSLPKAPYPISRAARMAAVDSALRDPSSMVATAKGLVDGMAREDLPSVIAKLVTALEIPIDAPHRPNHEPHRADDIWRELQKVADYKPSNLDLNAPAEWDQNTTFYYSLRKLLFETARMSATWKAAGGQPSREEFVSIRDHLATSISFDGTTPDEHRLIPPTYHAIGARVDRAQLLQGFLRLLATVESSLPGLKGSQSSSLPLEWNTPLGRVHIAGTGNDTHQGHFFLLIELGGNDTYREVGPPLSPGNTSLVIDLAGNDTVEWQNTPGPGAAVFGTSLWIDAKGDDNYTGRNLGLGAGLFGTGLFWDMEGNDRYMAGALTQGVGEYGIGIFMEGSGSDGYRAEVASQGYGGPGGIGILLDGAGDDTYFCGGKIPDTAKERIQRHKATHFLSMCQGYGFGLRDDVSGGIGLLVDDSGNDRYEADLFAQGGAYWFGLGMLLDRTGNDTYKAFEHCQGEGLHLGAGFLGDLAGNDTYSAYEHAQGVGIDRAAGILYEESGNDAYTSHQESQGAGIKPYGVGILFDAAGSDNYKALLASQGYSQRPPAQFPERQWPTGILIDLEGENDFDQPAIDLPTSEGRIQNRQGIAISR